MNNVRVASGEQSKMANEFPERYELRSGKFGPYFYDNVRSTDIGLSEIHELLNKKPKHMDLAQIQNDITIIISHMYDSLEKGLYFDILNEAVELIYLIQRLGKEKQQIKENLINKQIESAILP